MYDARSINKFQKIIILLIFKTFNVKILKYTFCREFNSEYQLQFYYYDNTVTSLINIR